VLLSTIVAGGLSLLWPQIPAVATGFAVIWALAWRQQHARSSRSNAARRALLRRGDLAAAADHAHAHPGLQGYLPAERPTPREQG